MIAKRIIPCLDIKDGKTVKGVNFVNIREAGNPVELGALYAEQGADELVFLDIAATVEKKKVLVELVKRIAAGLNIPFTVGGGIQNEKDVSVLLESGADKVSINSSAVKDPNLIDRIAKNFGSQCIVLAIDTRYNNKKWQVYIHGGRVPVNRYALEWAREGVDRGVGEILLTSMNHDGTKDGFALDITKKFSRSLHVPVIASGGAGTMQHFFEVFTEGEADAALAASIFHFGEIAIPQLKKYLQDRKICIRMEQ